MPAIAQPPRSRRSSFSMPSDAASNTVSGCRTHVKEAVRHRLLLGEMQHRRQRDVANLNRVVLSLRPANVELRLGKNSVWSSNSGSSAATSAAVAELDRRPRCAVTRRGGCTVRNFGSRQGQFARQRQRFASWCWKHKLPAAAAITWSFRLGQCTIQALTSRRTALVRPVRCQSPRSPAEVARVGPGCSPRYRISSRPAASRETTSWRNFPAEQRMRLGD